MMREVNAPVHGYIRRNSQPIEGLSGGDVADRPKINPLNSAQYSRQWPGTQR
jgi:hypothetical protein